LIALLSVRWWLGLSRTANDKTQQENDSKENS